MSGAGGGAADLVRWGALAVAEGGKGAQLSHLFGELRRRRPEGFPHKPAFSLSHSPPSFQAPPQSTPTPSPPSILPSRCTTSFCDDGRLISKARPWLKILFVVCEGHGGEVEDADAGYLCASAGHHQPGLDCADAGRDGDLSGSSSSGGAGVDGGEVRAR
eukprot:3866326-Rhodomonas_salina.1